MTNSWILSCLSALAAGSFAAGPVLAQDQGGAFNPVLADRFIFRAGAYFEQVDSAVAKESVTGNVGVEIDLERVGLDDDDISPFLYGRWRFTDRFRLELSYYGTDRSGSANASRDLIFGDLTIPVNVEVSSSFDVDLYVLDLGYSFIKDPRKELGVRLGVHAADLDVELAGAGFIGDRPVQAGRATADTLAPLPNVGLYGAYAFTPKLSLEGSLGYFSLNYGDYDGRIQVASAMLEYRFTRRFGVGLGYSFLDVDLDVDDDEFEEKYEVDFKGPIVFLSVGF